MGKDDRAHFEVHPSVVYQLGESLITDSVQALIELVKNAYDADATYAKVIIDTEGKIDVPEAKYSGKLGRIIVEDDGYGMTPPRLKRGWLLISNRAKLRMKKHKRTTPGGRTPLGDKGLGRLGVQRLGEALEIFTQAKDRPGVHMAFSWCDFTTARTLRDVDVYLSPFSCPRPKGTTIVVSRLRDLEMWRGHDAITRLQRELSQMISPYREIRQFTVFVEVDGKSIDMVEISENLRDLAPVRYTIDFNGRVLSIRGRAQLAFFRPSRPEDADAFALIVEADNGKAFFDFMSRQKDAAGLNLKRSKSNRWFVEFERSRKFKDIDKLEGTLFDKGPANPGPFHGEIDSFDLGRQTFDEQQVFDHIKEYRDHIKNLGGIRVYRDGFAIRVDRDWLQLGAQWTGARSWYGLKPDNAHGFISLSARDNIDLEETTDREGFKDTPHYRNFYALLTDFREFTGDAHNVLGRSWSKFREKHNEQLAKIDSRKTAEDITREIGAGIIKAPHHGSALGALRTDLEKGITESWSVAAKLASASGMTPKLREDLTIALSRIKTLLSAARDAAFPVSQYLEELGTLRGMGQVLEDRVSNLRRQMDDMYETVALGLTAEALSHEIFNIADRLAGHAKSAHTHVRRKGITDPKIVAFIEHVNTSVIALRKQISFLSPALRYVREEREIVDDACIVEHLASFYEERLAKSGIVIKIRHAGNRSIRLRMNRGKLYQIINNLVLNSEYWLKEDIAQRRLRKGAIFFELEPPFLRVWDNGRGIDPVVEDRLFEPFVSAKSNGRGLGLFIIRQLLVSENCNVEVVPERNRHHRLYKFQIDFQGAMNG